MKKYLFTTFLFSVSTLTNATVKDSTIIYDLPDSVKAVQFMAEITVQSFNVKKRCAFGIKTDAFVIALENNLGRSITLRATGPHINLGRGTDVGFELKNGDPQYRYDWETGQPYKLLISQATDSSGNFSLYSGYIFFPKENKWKWIGTMKMENRWNTIQQPASFYYSRKKEGISITTGQVWIQKNNGSWKNMKNETLPNPIINLLGHVDSVQQRQIDIKIIDDAIANGKTDVKDNEQGVYYTIMKEGTGRPVSPDDTVSVFYKGYLFVNNSVFDQTKDKPATFPLKRLIRGWQIGVPICRVGGKIKLVIPSDLAYSIRTRAAKIPPNSILVFEIEVLEVKSPITGN